MTKKIQMQLPHGANIVLLTVDASLDFKQNQKKGKIQCVCV